ncbi:PREDICTED: aquaporin-7-like isoform X2 [Lepidothrix coronata]|uniref:Aquaporin-7-like isoform X2 n=1 Tax=Lepidothrix coronata TaxID=321398 RepID=A0A6J0HKL2_9PASS|nr:PREDICTED: aquaporin-7-like isoform X2 [Lepidothrix coronata]
MDEYVQEHRVYIPRLERTMFEKIKKALTIQCSTVRELLAETLGTFILMVFGLSSVAQVVLGKGNTGQYLSINMAFGIGVTLGIHASGGVSGGHLNAAITIMEYILGNLSWKKLIAYLTGQFLGSFTAAATVFGLYYDALYDYTKGNFTVTGPIATAPIFATYPAPNVSLLGAFFTEFTATVMLVLGVQVIHDEKNNAALKGTQPLVTGILVLGIGLGMGMNTGYAINPSRDLPPRIFTAIAGWGTEVFTAGRNWWWVPVTAPVLGSLAGVLMYKLFIDFHNQADEEIENKKEQRGVEISKL